MPRWLGRPSSSPNTRRMKVPVWRMTPGSAMVALICATPPITASLPRMGASRSLASMPFCSGMTAVSGPTMRADGCAGALHVPQLDAEQDDVDRADGGWVVGGLGGVEVDVAARAKHLRPLGAHRRQVRAAREEGHVRAGLRQRRPERPADAAGADYRDRMVSFPVLSASPVRKRLAGGVEGSSQKSCAGSACEPADRRAAA